MQQVERGPSRRGYLMAAIVFLVGLMGAAALVAVFVTGLLGLGDDLVRTVGPGSSEIELTETGRYTIYYEYESEVDGTTYSTGEQTPALSISVTRLADGEELEVRPSSMSITYDLMNYSGHSIRTFEVNEPGSYEISVEYAEGQIDSPFVLAIGQGVARGILTSIGGFLGGGLIFCVFTLGSIVIAGITIYRRHQFQRQQET